MNELLRNFSGRLDKIFDVNRPYLNCDCWKPSFVLEVSISNFKKGQKGIEFKFI